MPRMRRVVVAAFLLASLVTFSGGKVQGQDVQALATASREQLDVIKVLLAQRDAWNRGDIEGFVREYKNSPDTVVVTHQISHGFAGLLEEYRHDYPNKAAMGTLTFSELEPVSLDAKFAMVVGKYHLERDKKNGGNADGVFSMVLEKTDKGWKIILDHTT